ncbi:hypothetical protein K504DRAFT_531898 [Pleomassaria siparia CBS 279.74]|uniref:Uncharacterized protein n=1 Tax=Pleomassaria siparia CBS 279.74 TaxID=1314801 RepID=A0A6G1KF88_9PLEO|nr:hypothetical protein K504DRAFT_531898 [Pleomassaria siparia CBS 279.74]
MDASAYEKKKIGKPRANSLISKGLADIHNGGQVTMDARQQQNLHVSFPAVMNHGLPPPTPPPTIPTFMPYTASNFEAELSPDTKSLGKVHQWCGQPQSPGVLKVSGNLPPLLQAVRYRTLTEKNKPKLSNITKNNQRYLLLTKELVMAVSPLYNSEAEPITDVSLFKRLMVDEELNRTHADHIVAALDRIGVLCHELIIMGTVKTNACGDVFGREQDDSRTGNDWHEVFKSMGNLKGVTVDSTGASIHHYRNTVSRVKAALKLAYKGGKMPTLTET